MSKKSLEAVEALRKSSNKQEAIKKMEVEPSPACAAKSMKHKFSLFGSIKRKERKEEKKEKELKAKEEVAPKVEVKASAEIKKEAIEELKEDKPKVVKEPKKTKEISDLKKAE